MTSTKDIEKPVEIATQLAKHDATVDLIHELTKLKKSFIRVIIQHLNKQVVETNRRRSPIADWVDQDHHRRLDATKFILAYNMSNKTSSRAARIIRSYKTYVITSATSEAILSIDECYEIAMLYERQEAWIASCIKCNGTHLVIYDAHLCPVCISIEEILCQHCKRPIENTERDDRRGRRTQFCKRTDCLTDRNKRTAGRKYKRKLANFA
jgi:hypothetical protein